MKSSIVMVFLCICILASKEGIAQRDLPFAREKQRQSLPKDMDNQFVGHEEIWDVSSLFLPFSTNTHSINLRTNGDPVQRLDSIVVEKNIKYEYDYDDFNNRLSYRINYKWDLVKNDWAGEFQKNWIYYPNGKLYEEVNFSYDKNLATWVFYSSYTYEYNANGQLIESIFSVNGNSIFPEPSYKGTFSYDAKGNLTQEIKYNWNSIQGNWVGEYRSDYNYNADNHVTNFTLFYWNSAIGIWTLNSKQEFIYDSSGKEIQVIESKWDSSKNTWVFLTKGVSAYNAKGELVEKISSSWDAPKSSWVFSWKENQTYDSNGNRTELISYWWNMSASKWFGDKRSDYTYDSKGNQTQIVSFTPDNSNFTWNPLFRTTIQYDVNGNRTQWAYYDWDSGKKAWIGSRKYDNVFDYNYSVDDLLLPIEDGLISEKNKLLTRNNFTFNKNSSQWVFESVSTYYYSDKLSSFLDEYESKLSVYPNPALDQLGFNGLESGTFHIEIFDLRGVNVLSQAFDSKGPVFIGFLNNGIYFYRIHGNGLIGSGSFIKQ